MALTRDTVFWEAFSAHAKRTTKASRLLLEMLEKPSQADRLSREISVLENEGDKITHDTVLTLHQTWITPLDREEIHGLITKLDDVLDFVEAASERIALYEIRESTPEAKELARVLIQCADEIATAVDALTDMKNAHQLLQHCIAINKFENDADTIFRRALAKLFKGGAADPPSSDGIDPLLVMKWRDIYESLETATDRAEDVANIIEGIVLEHA